MERVIKFRAWDEDAQRYEWIGACAGFFGGELTPDGSRNIKFEQFTGLHDKNGKEIYEGDVVKVFDVYGEINIKGVIIFQDGSFCIKSDACTYYRWMDYEAEIISNIHEMG